MKSHRSILLTFAIALIFAGCGYKADDGHAHESVEAGHAEESESGITFNAKKGLLISPATAKFIGLQVAEVEERKVHSQYQFSAQVYRTASEVQLASLQPSVGAVTLASGNISASEAAGLSEGQAISVRQGTEGQVLAGRIVALHHDLEKTRGHVEVLLAISDALQPLSSGAFVSVTVSQGGERNVVSVPRSALFRTTEGDFFYTVSGEHYVRTPIKPGAANADFVEVTDGLYQGDQIVVRPTMTLWLAELQSLRGGKACADGH